MAAVGVVAVSPQEAAERLLECVCDALADAGRAVCSCYQTVGTPVVGKCCDCGEDDFEMTGELSIHFRRIFDADPNTLLEVQRVRPCKGGTLAASYRMVLARCFPTVNEHGELPQHEALTEKAEEQHEDIAILWQSLACCSGMNLRIDDISIDPNPQIGCSFLYADVTVSVQVPALQTAGSS